MVHLYAYINDLLHQHHDSYILPHNLWCGKTFSYVDCNWCRAGLFTATDLPAINGKLDVASITLRLKRVWVHWSPYLKCCTFQKNLAKYFDTNVMGTFIPNPLLPVAMKSLLQRETSVMLSLDNWCHSLQLLPLSVPESKMVFQWMLVCCKITKFQEVNFKILAQILATPKILAMVKNQDNIHLCVVWCWGYFRTYLVALSWNHCYSLVLEEI